MPCSNCLMLKPRLWIPNKSLTFSILKKNFQRCKGGKRDRECYLWYLLLEDVSIDASEKEAREKTISDLDCESLKCSLCDSTKQPPRFNPPLDAQKTCSNVKPCKQSEKSSQGW